MNSMMSIGEIDIIELFDRIINKRVQTYFFVEGCIIVGELSRDEIFNQNAALC
jgi:hypothetical protein